MRELWKEFMMGTEIAYVQNCRVSSDHSCRNGPGIFRKPATFREDMHIGDASSNGDLPERGDQQWECLLAGCFLRHSRKNEWKIQRISHKCRKQDESGKRRKTLTDMQGMRRSIPEKKLPYPWGKGRFFSIGKYLGYLDREMQLRQLSLYEKNLEVEIGNLKKEASGKKKLYRGLGVFGGLLLAVLLV